MIFGLLTFLLSFSVTYFFPKELRKSFFIVVTIHAIVILFYTYSGMDMIGATEDADSFYKHAIERSVDISRLDWGISSLSNGHDFFKNIHALLQHYFFGPAKIISYSTSLFAWSLCLFILSKIYLTICEKDFNSARILIYIFSLTPSILIFNSYLLREVWLSLIIFSLIYFAIVLRDYRKKITYLLLIGIVSILFHRFMILITSSVLAILFIYDATYKYRWYPFDNRKIFAYLFIFFTVGLIVINMDLEAISFIKNYGILGAIDQYTIGLVGGHGDGAPPARTTYGKIFDKDNFFSFFEVFIAYQFMPFPWHVSSILDLAPMFENFVRFGFVIIFFYYRRKINMNKKMNLDMIFIVWLFVELIWSIGTINWGTAYRHHTVAYGLLIIVALASRSLVKKTHYE